MREDNGDPANLPKRPGNHFRAAADLPGVGDLISGVHNGDQSQLRGAAQNPQIADIVNVCPLVEGMDLDALQSGFGDANQLRLPIVSQGMHRTEMKNAAGSVLGDGRVVHGRQLGGVGGYGKTTL